MLDFKLFISIRIIYKIGVKFNSFPRYIVCDNLCQQFGPNQDLTIRVQEKSDQGS